VRYDLKTELQINDFALFCETIQNITNISTSVKLTFTESGFFTSVASEGKVARVDIKSNSVSVPNGIGSVSMCTKELNILSQLLNKIVKSHILKGRKNQNTTPDYSDVSISIEELKVNLKSSTLKTSIFLVDESVIQSFNPFDKKCTEIAKLSIDNIDLKEILSSTILRNGTRIFGKERAI